MDELVNFCTLYDTNYNIHFLFTKFTFAEKEEVTISDLAATMTEIEDVETGVSLTRDMGINIGNKSFTILYM